MCYTKAPGKGPQGVFLVTTKKTNSSRYHQKMIGNCKARTMNKLRQSDENHETDYKKCLAVL